MDQAEALKDWFEHNEIEQYMYDVSGGDWDDLLALVQASFEAGWDARYATLTTKDI